MASDSKIIWSDESLKNLDEILSYLNREWSQTETNAFIANLFKFIDLISSNPELFPRSDFNPSLRRAVMSKQTSIFYKAESGVIHLVSIFNNRKSIERIKQD